MMQDENKKFKLFTIISLICFGLACLPAMAMSMFSAMLFDSPGSEENMVVITIAFSVLTFIPVYLFSLVASIKLLRKNKLKKAFYYSLLPLINGIVMVVGMLLWE